MIIDLSRRPLIIYPEECTASVVVRSVGNRTVSGFVSFWVMPDRAGRRMIDLGPDAQMTKGDVTCYETRLPLPGAKVVTNGHSPYEYVYEGDQRRGRPQGRPGSDPEKEKLAFPPDPFECPSVWKDMLTGTTGTWRVNVRIEYVLRMKKAPWIVSVIDGVNGTTLSTVAVSGLDPNPLVADSLPLKRAVAKTALPGNAWTRILDDDD